MPPLRGYVIKTPCAQIGRTVLYYKAYRTKRSALKALRAFVKESAAECKRLYKKCGVIKHSPDYYELRVGGKDGFHLWERAILAEPEPGVPIREWIP